MNDKTREALESAMAAMMGARSSMVITKRTIESLTFSIARCREALAVEREPSDSEIERVARAIYGKSDKSWDDCINLSKTHPSMCQGSLNNAIFYAALLADFRSRAKAAIAAMKFGA